MRPTSLTRLVAALALLCAATAASAANRSYTLFITPGTHAVNGAGGATLGVWGYTDVAGANPMVPGPLLEAEEGDTVTVTVYNQHSLAHNFVVRGLSSDATAIAAGGSRTYSFPTANAGVYLYHDSLNSNINREMGLYGAVVVRAAGGANRAWSGGPAFDAERLWIVSEMDKARWNDVAAAGGSVNTGVYRPNYFMLNGQGGFDAMHDPSSVLSVATGQVGLVRIANAGQFDHSLHFHGNHFQLIAVDGNRLGSFEWSDTYNIKPGTTAMLLFRQPAGIYPMHIHTAQMETANGVYLNGVATLLVGQ
jgi:FtsP/CotA-like multicopper oxidase with cupredoxin domain